MTDILRLRDRRWKKNEELEEKKKQRRSENEIETGGVGEEIQRASAMHRYGGEEMRKRGEAEGDEAPGSVDINKHLPNATAEPQGAPVLHAAPRIRDQEQISSLGPQQNHGAERRRRRTRIKPFLNGPQNKATTLKLHLLIFYFSLSLFSVVAL